MLTKLGVERDAAPAPDIAPVEEAEAKPEAKPAAKKAEAKKAA